MTPTPVDLTPLQRRLLSALDDYVAELVNEIVDARLHGLDEALRSVDAAMGRKPPPRRWLQVAPEDDGRRDP